MTTEITIGSSMRHLEMNAEEFLSKSTTTAAHDRLVIGVAVFHPLRDEPAVLIVQRSAHEDFLPNVWELPGGHVEATDANIIEAVRRETYEETGLVVTRIMGQFEDFVYKVERQDEETGVIATKSTLQLNIAVDVAVERGASGGEPIVKLNADEHQAFAWVSKADLASYTMTKEMGQGGVVSHALTWKSNHAQNLQV